MLTDLHKLATCAAHFASGEAVSDFDAFASWAKHKELGTELKRLLTALNALPWVRRVNRGGNAVPIPPVLMLEGETVRLDGMPIGHLLTWHRIAFPQEAQARIAYDSLIDRFLAHLAATRKIIALFVNDLTVWAFAPSNAEADLGMAWQEFMQVAFSRAELEKSFVLLMNSVKLTDRGFGAVEFPITTPAAAEVQAAFYLATLEQRVLYGSDAYKAANTRYQELDRRRRDAEQKKQPARIEELAVELAKISMQRADALRANREQFEVVVAQLGGQIPPDTLARLRQLAARFNPLARNQFSYGTVQARTGNPKAGHVRNSIEDMIVKLKDFKNPPVYILGVGEGNSHEHISQARSLTTSAAKEAGERAHTMAGFGPQDIDVAELYDCFTPVVIVELEDMGFCPQGEGGEVRRRGSDRAGGRPTGQHPRRPPVPLPPRSPGLALFGHRGGASTARRERPSSGRGCRSGNRPRPRRDHVHSRYDDLGKGENVMATSAKPTPVPTSEPQPYWEGCKNHELRIQECDSCGHPQFYPRLYCTACMSDRVHWVTASGRGKVLSFTIVYLQ